MTSVPVEHHDSVEVPTNYHFEHNLQQLLEKWHYIKLKNGAEEGQEIQYGLNERREIIQFYDFVQ